MGYTLNGYSSRERFYCPDCDEELDHEDPAYEDALLCDVESSCVHCLENEPDFDLDIENEFKVAAV